MKPFLKVIRQGSCTTIQDKGRYGLRKFGTPPSGALDKFAYIVANMLTGADEDSAALEFTYFGGRFEVLSDAKVAVTGAEMDIRLNGREIDVWRSFRINCGDTLVIGQAKSGCRAYLAVAGGIDAPMIMGSRSCFAGAKFGGLYGRALKSGDIVYIGKGKQGKGLKRLSDAHRPKYVSEVSLRAIPGPQEDYFEMDVANFFGKVYKVSHQSSRLGYRLEGPEICIADGKPKSIVSEPSLPGSVQIPENGLPIILLSEQTVGGYAKIATVVSADIDRIAQLLPGDLVRFERVDIETAHRLFFQYFERLERIEEFFEWIDGYPGDNSETFQKRYKEMKEWWRKEPEQFAKTIYRRLDQSWYGRKQ